MQAWQKQVPFSSAQGVLAGSRLSYWESYDYDNIGNRESASSGGDVNGGNLRTTAFHANALNQYTNIATLGYEDILGFAVFTNSVTVNSGTADRKVEYFHREITVANGSGPVWQNVAVTCGGTTTNRGLVFPDDDQQLTYDLDGNLTFDGIWNYEWDGENRLRAMTMVAVANIAPTNRLKLEFTYDYQGRRVQKIVSTNSSGNLFAPMSTNRFVYDGWNLITVLSPQSSVLQSFIWGQDLSGTEDGAGGIGGLIAVMEYGGDQMTNANFCAYDGNGNITALVRPSDSLPSARYEYSPFGELLRAIGPLARSNPIRWSTKFWDEESGLVSYPARNCAPSLGRWLSRDPIEEEDSANLYTFVRNGVPNASDPFGKLTLSEEESAAGIEGNMMADAAGAARQAWSFYKQAQDMVDTFNDLQQIADAVMTSDIGGMEGSENLLASFLGAGQQAMALGLSGHTKYTSKGQKMHEIFKRAARSAGMQTEVRLGAGMRVDAMDAAKKIIFEVKPWTKTGRKKGTAQLTRYLNELWKKDKNWTGQLIFY